MLVSRIKRADERKTEKKRASMTEKRLSLRIKRITADFMHPVRSGMLPSGTQKGSREWKLPGEPTAHGYERQK